MPAIDPDTLLERLKWRFAIKKFDPTKKIPGELWDKFESALQHSPSSLGLQPWKFIVVRDPELRKQLSTAARGQPQILDCSHLIIICAKTKLTQDDVNHYMDVIAKTRNQSLADLQGFKEMVGNAVLRGAIAAMMEAWARRQCYIALGTGLTSAALLGIDACPMEGFEPEKFDEILGLKARNLGSAVLLACGYRNPDDPYVKRAKVRFDKSEVFEHR